MSDKEKTDNEFVDKIKFLAILSGFYALGLASGTADQMMKTSNNIDWGYLISNTVSQSSVVFSGATGILAVLNYLNKKRGR
jgi:hypothetical protein